MRYLHTFLIAVVASALSLGTSASAEEGGEMTLDIGGQTVAVPMQPVQSDWSGSESWASVSIYGQPTDAAVFETYKAFSLAFELVNGTAGSGEARLSTSSDGEIVRYFADQSDDLLEVTVDSVDISSQLLTVVGTFAATMGTSENFGRDVDTSDPIEVTGEFSVTLGPVE